MAVCPVLALFLPVSEDELALFFTVETLCVTAIYGISVHYLPLENGVRPCICPVLTGQQLLAVRFLAVINRSRATLNRREYGPYLPVVTGSKWLLLPIAVA